MISIVKDINFEEQKENIIQLMETDSKARDAIQNTQFKVGERISVEIEIIDDYLSSSLYGLLFNTIPGSENLGFKVTAFGATLDRTKLLHELNNLITRIHGNEI